MVTYFKYLGWAILATGEYWLAVVGNLSHAKTVWSMIYCILIREGATPLVYGLFFKAVIQAVLLFGS